MATRTESPAAAGNASRTAPHEPTGRVTDNVAKAAHEAVDRAADTAGRAEDRVRRAASEGEERLREKSAEARASTERALEQFKQYTRDNPMTSAGIAFAAGLIVSRMLSR